MITTIRTRNFDAMKMFYRDKLKFEPQQGEFERAIWLNGFKTEIHIQEVASTIAADVHGELILHSQDVTGIAEMFSSRGISVELYPSQTATEARFRDPDGNIVRVVPNDMNP